MKRRVALIEFVILDQFPLISGYLRGYAQTDPAVAEAFEFVFHYKEVERVSYAETLTAIRKLNAEVLCFSAYVWNMGLVRRLIRDLGRDPSVKTIILGGHQISNQIRHYVDPTNEKIVVINGQGEIAFRAVLSRLAHGRDLVGLRGVSFFVGKELYCGGEAEMLVDLDQLPSPFLTGMFDSMKHPIAVFETNRGCPFKCTFCTWGGDTLRVTKFSLDRIKEELRWIAKKSVLFIYIADANWGMLPRDIEISEYIGEMKRIHGYPWMVYYAAAKNKPRGSITCIQKFHEAGVITSQALGIQSMNPETLELIDRKNIRNSAFIEMFDDLKKLRIDSYCELIWPLPGETLHSLRRGFDELVGLGAQTITMYPTVLINNARLTNQMSEFEMEGQDSGDWKSELKVVKKTKHASRKDVESGLWFFYSYFLLANTDLAKGLVRFLAAISQKEVSRIVSGFADYIRDDGVGSAYARLIDTLFREEAHGSLVTIGRVTTHLTHEQRRAAIADVVRFVLTHELSHDVHRGMAIVTLWALAFPRLFADARDYAGETMAVLDEVAAASSASLSSSVTARGNGRSIELAVGDDASGFWREAIGYYGVTRSTGRPMTIRIEHPSASLLPYNQTDRTRNWLYAHGMIQRLGYISPSIAVEQSSSLRREVA